MPLARATTTRSPSSKAPPSSAETGRDASNGGSSSGGATFSYSTGAAAAPRGSGGGIDASSSSSARSEAASVADLTSGRFALGSALSHAVTSAARAERSAGVGARLAGTSASTVRRCSPLFSRAASSQGKRRRYSATRSSSACEYAQPESSGSGAASPGTQTPCFAFLTARPTSRRASPSLTHTLPVMRPSRRGLTRSMRAAWPLG